MSQNISRFQFSRPKQLIKDLKIEDGVVCLGRHVRGGPGVSTRHSRGKFCFKILDVWRRKLQTFALVKIGRNSINVEITWLIFAKCGIF